MAKATLLDFPTTVKEVVDWLVRIQELRKSSDLYLVIRNMFDDKASMQFGMSDISTLCNAVHGFHVTIKNTQQNRYRENYKPAKWPSCGEDNKCGCDTYSRSACEHGSCCAKCPLRHLAMFFCFALPFLHQRFSDLKKECESKRNQKLEKGQSRERLGYYFHAEGYLGQDMSNSVRGSDLIPMLEKVIHTLDQVNKNLADDISKCTLRTVKASPTLFHGNSSTPNTTYHMLMWLCGLPFSKAFPELMNHITRQAQDLLVPFYKTYHDVPKDGRGDLWRLVTRVPTLVHGFHRSHGPFLSEFSRIASGERFNYPNNVTTLISNLWDYLYKSFCNLKFLCLMCHRTPQNGGWGHCQYGRKVSACSQHNGYHCTKCDVSNPKRNDGCLQAFITAGSSTSETCAFSNPDYAPMGFKSVDLAEHSNSGGFILNFLKVFVSHTASVLTKDDNPGLLCKVLSPLFILRNQPPTSLSSLFSFVLCFGRSVRRKSQGQGFVDVLKVAIPDSKRCNMTAFLGALKRCVSRGSGHSSSNSTDHEKNLLYITGCNPTASYASDNCPPYLYPLDLEIFRRVFIMEFAYIVLGWLSRNNLIDTLFRKLTSISNAVNGLPCSQFPQHPCNPLRCQHMHTTVFKHGLTFGGSLHLGSGIALCSDLNNRLKLIITGSAVPLLSLMNAASTISTGVCRTVFGSSTPLPPSRQRRPSGVPKARSEDDDHDDEEGGTSENEEEGEEGEDAESNAADTEIEEKAPAPSPPTSSTPLKPPTAAAVTFALCSQKPSLLPCPQSVKESIDWLLCVGGYGCGSAVTQASSAPSGFIPNLAAALDTMGIHVSHELGSGRYTDGFRQGDLYGLTASLSCLMGYTVPSVLNHSIPSITICKPSGTHGIASEVYRYSYADASWPVCNATYCGCRTHSSSKPCAGSCCDECPERICARIFCLIVPVVYAALNFLSDMLQLSDGSSSNRSYSQWRSHTFCDTSHSLDIYMKLLGFSDSDLRCVSGEKLHNCLANAVQQLGRATAWIHCSLGSGSGDMQPCKFLVTFANVNPLPLPMSVRDSLLWILFMPYCCSDFPIVMRYLGHKTQSVTEGSSGLRRAIAYSPPLSTLLTTAVLVILGAEYAAGIKADASSTSSSVNQRCTLFGAIEMLSLGYPRYYYGNTYGYHSGSEGTALRMLMSLMPIVHWGISQLWSVFCGPADGGSNNDNRHGHVLSDLGFGNSHVSSTMSPSDLWQYAYDMYAGAASDLYMTCGYIISSVRYSHQLRRPVTIRAMLLWLLCLIPCGQLNGLSSLGNSINNVIKRCPPVFTSSSTSPVTEGLTTLRQFHATMYHFMVTVPSVFLVMEGNLAGLFTGMYQFLGISVIDAHTTSHDSYQSLSLSTNGSIQRNFCSTIYIVYMLFWYLHQRCASSSNTSISDNPHLGLWATSDSFTSGSLARFVEFLGFQRPSGYSAGSVIGTSSYDSPSLTAYNVHTVLYFWFGAGTSSNRLSPLWLMCHVAMEYLSSLPTTSTAILDSTPSNVRDILLWLVGVPAVVGFRVNGNTSSKGVAVSEIPQKIAVLQKTFSTSSPPDWQQLGSLSVNDFQPLLVYSAVCSMQLVECIEGDLSSVYYYLNGMSNWSFNQSSYTSCLLKTLCDYVYVVTVQLRFLGAQCSRPGDKGGWRYCSFASHTARSQEGSVSSLVCSCSESSEKSGTTQCSHGLLWKFLTGSSRTTLTTDGTPFSRCFTGTTSDNSSFNGYVPMGFNACSGHDRTGERIHDILCEFLDFPSSNSQSSATTSHRALTLLCQWLIALTHREPECLGDYIAFFQEFRESGEHSSVDSHCLFERPVFSNGALVKGVGTLASLLSGELKCTNGCDHHVVVYRYPTHAPP